MEDLRETVRRRLKEGRIGEIYANSYRSIVDRLGEDGFFPESLDGGYGWVEFCRTIGALEALFSTTGEYEKAQRAVGFALESAVRCGLSRIPHIAHPVAEDGSQQFSTDDQVDGTLHVLGAFARLGRDGHLTPEFEDKWYPYVRDMLNIVCDMPYFYYNPQPFDLYPRMFPPESMRLVYNCSFEHSREKRRWSCFDMLSQCFFGGALEAMTDLATRRGETADAEHYRFIRTLLSEGVEEYMTREVNGRKVYVEMRLPDGGWGRPFIGMGWPLLSSMAARWQPLSEDVLDNTVAELRYRLWREAPHTAGLHYLCGEENEAGAVEPSIPGKVVGWDIIYSLQKGDFAHILEWFDFLEAVNTTDLIAECFVPTDKGWHLQDPGNGEQTCWWCWAIAQVRLAVGHEPTVIDLPTQVDE